jgi:hypothetical protein
MLEFMFPVSVKPLWSIFRKSGIRFSVRKYDKRKNVGAVSVSGQGETALEHFQEKWNPVFRPKMRQAQKCWSGFDFRQGETAPELLMNRRGASCEGWTEA